MRQSDMVEAFGASLRVVTLAPQPRMVKKQEAIEAAVFWGYEGSQGNEGMRGGKICRALGNVNNRVDEGRAQSLNSFDFRASYKQ